MLKNAERYYLTHLKGKSDKEILSNICSLKKQMNKIKRIIEDVTNGLMVIIVPFDVDVLSQFRYYLDMAKKSLDEIGCPYKPTKEEIRAQQFQNNLENICNIFVHINHHNAGYSNINISIGDFISRGQEHNYVDEKKCPFDTIRPSFSKKEFFNVLRLLHLDEWERKYTTECYGYNIDDGIEWFVEIDFYNGMKSRRFEGCNSFPYNFNMFLELIGIRHFFGFYVDFGKKD